MIERSGEHICLHAHANHPSGKLNNTITAISVRRLKRNRRRLVGLGLVRQNEVYDEDVGRK